MVWSAIKLALVMKHTGPSQISALPHFGVACIINHGIFGK